ncbi:hypothetical protein BC834DRAFT_904854, partial [Gloeopeniophorella convolvens]
MRLPPRTWTHAPSRAAKDRHRALTSTAMPLQVRAAALPSTLHAGLPARRHPTCGTEPVMTLDANTHKSSPRSRHFRSERHARRHAAVLDEAWHLHLGQGRRPYPHDVVSRRHGRQLVRNCTPCHHPIATRIPQALSCHTLPCKTSGSCASSVGITLSLSGTRRPKVLHGVLVRSLPHRTNSFTQVPEVHAVGLEDVWPRCAVFGYIS